MIGVVTTSFPRSESDFAGSFVLAYVEALRQGGHKVEVIAPSPRQNVCKAWCKRQSLTLLPAGKGRFNPFYDCGVPDNLRKRPYAALGLVQFGRELQRELASRRWNAQINHWAFPYGLLAAPSAKQVGIFHSADLFALRRMPARRRLASSLRRRLAGTHFVNADQREQFSRLLPSFMVPRAMETSMVQAMPAAAPPSLAPRELIRAHLRIERSTIVTLGRLIAIKAIERAIDAIKGMSGVDLVVAGDGPERQRLEKRARGFTDRIRFVGPVEAADKWRWLHACDALLVPSRTTRSGRTEGSPTVIAEARAIGCPVVTTLDATKQNFTDDPLLFLSSPQPRALAAALQKAMRTERRTYRPHSMQDIVAQHLKWLGLDETAFV